MSYLAEHFHDDKSISFNKNKQESDFKIVSTKIHSRHYSKKENRDYVSYIPVGSIPLKSEISLNVNHRKSSN